MAYVHRWLTDEESQSIRKRYNTDLISPIYPADMVSDDSKKSQLIGLMAGRDGVPYIALAILDGREIVVEYDHAIQNSEHRTDANTWKVMRIYASPNQSAEIRSEIHDFMRKHKKQIPRQIASLIVGLETEAYSATKKVECLVEEGLIL